MKTTKHGGGSVGTPPIRIRRATVGEVIQSAGSNSADSSNKPEPKSRSNNPNLHEDAPVTENPSVTSEESGSVGTAGGEATKTRSSRRKPRIRAMNGAEEEDFVF